MDDTSPIPSRDALQEWLNTVAADVREGRVSAVELAEQLADVRRAARDFGHLADWLLLAAREQGAGLPILAAAWSASGRRELVHGPDARLHKLIDRGYDTTSVQETFDALDTHDPVAPWRETP